MSEIQEALSVNEVVKFCALSKHLSGTDIHSNDKTISWDGNIIYYEKERGKKSGNEHLIPVQIKGKCVDKLPEVDTLNYPLKVTDLDNYFKNWGVLFILGIIASGKVKLYMRLLLPVDIIKLKAGKKDSQSSITATLHHVGSPEELDEICDFYIKNCHKQSYLVYDDKALSFEKYERIHASLLSDKKNNLPISLIRSKGAYFYGIKNDISIPINFQLINISDENECFFEIENSFADYMTVKRIFTEEANKFIIQDAFKITNLVKGHDIKIDTVIDINLNFYGVNKAAKFILALLNNGNMKMNGVDFINSESEEKFTQEFRKIISSDFKHNLEYLIYLGNICEQLKISKSEFLTKELIENEEKLLILKNILINNYTASLQTDSDRGLFNYEIAGKKILIEYIKCEDGLFQFSDYLNSDSESRIYFLDEGVSIKATKYLAIEDKIIVDTIFDKDKMIYEIEKQEGMYHFNLLNSYVLSYIYSYDQKKDLSHLQFAERLLSIIQKHTNEEPSTIINYLQIQKRTRSLTEVEKKKLTSYKIKESEMIICCACILLEQYEEFDIRFNLLSEQNQEEFMKWPIYYLYKLK